MGFREIPEQRSSYWKNLIAEIEVVDHPKKYQEIEQRHAFSHLSWAITAPNLFLVLILLMSLITPSSCADSKTTVDSPTRGPAPTPAVPPVRIQMPSGAGKDEIRKALSQSWTETETRGGGGSQRVIKITNEHATEYTAQMQEGNWKMGSGSGRVNTNNEHFQVVEKAGFQMHGNSKTAGGSRQVKVTSYSAHGEISSQETFQNWVTHSGSGLMDEIARTLGIEKKDIRIETAKAALTSLKPPSPPSDTVKGYIRWLDEPRPTTIEEYLRNFQVMFVVDDSGSMKGERWKATRDALATIAQKASELKVDTMNMRFLNNASYIRGLKGKKKLISLFDKVKPKGKTPLGRRLKVVFDEHLNGVDSAVREGPEKYSKILPLDIIVLTDGMPTDKGEDEPTKVVAKVVKRMTGSHYHPNTMNVQIVQIADEEKAKKMLRDLVVGDNGRIVDTVPYTGIVDSEKLQKILLKGVHPNIRSQVPEDMLAI